MDKPETANHKFTKAGDYKFSSRPATAEEISAAREAFSDPAMRSCWECNSAHAHFLNDTTDDFSFMCLMGCGRFFHNGIDVTDYS